MGTGHDSVVSSFVRSFRDLCLIRMTTSIGSRKIVRDPSVIVAERA